MSLLGGGSGVDSNPDPSRSRSGHQYESEYRYEDGAAYSASEEGSAVVEVIRAIVTYIKLHRYHNQSR
jgi:hypothetical protein